VNNLYTHFPGFREDRVNFHQESGGNTAWQGDSTWPNRTGYSILCAIMLRSGGGEWGGGKSLVARERRAAAGGEGGSLRSTVLCCVFSLSLLLLFPLFAVLLNCLYPDPPVSACFFPFSSAPRQGEGGPRGASVAGCSQTMTLNLVPKHGAGIMAGLNSGY